LAINYVACDSCFERDAAIIFIKIFAGKVGWAGVLEKIVGVPVGAGKLGWNMKPRFHIWICGPCNAT
jgi:hypothetical protein